MSSTQLLNSSRIFTRYCIANYILFLCRRSRARYMALLEQLCNGIRVNVMIHKLRRRKIPFARGGGRIVITLSASGDHHVASVVIHSFIKQTIRSVSLLSTQIFVLIIFSIQWWMRQKSLLGMENNRRLRPFFE